MKMLISPIAHKDGDEEGTLSRRKKVPLLRPVSPHATQKNVAKKCATGGSAQRVGAPLDSPVVSSVPEALETVPTELELPAETHSVWCMICCDGAEDDVLLYQCDACLRVMCSQCIDVPCRISAGHPTGQQSFFFVYPVTLSPLSGPLVLTFGNIPAQGGKAVLPHFLQLNGKFETASCTLLASTPIAVIHFIIGANDEVITPVPLLSHYLEHFYPSGRYVYLEVVFNVATHKKIDTYTLMQQAQVAELTQHLDSGWLFAGKVKDKYIAMSISQVLSTVLCPYASILKAANMVFLVCGSIVAYEDSFVNLKDTILDLELASAIIFPATRFQPLVATNFLLAMAELVIVEKLNLRKAFPGLLALSSRLGQHSKVILMTKDDTADNRWLLVTMFGRAHPQTQPWGIEVPGQCPLCGLTNSWSEKVAVMLFDVDTGDQATGKPPHKFHISKPPGSMVSGTRTKQSTWFQSPSSIFPPPPSPPSSPPSSSISFMSLGTLGKRSRSRDGSVSTRKRACV
ncbi:hypothetical protein DFJ58DRAFT_729245 [Suillus subalutaceus]|uniref:uncharacterized protein n=1 Tax=Suillus subalutaceus TaxID=48586 RepID=UPI001B864BD6|nr:uncharacterized protein DFJ58DRAFT_729245 [Suillus subalutaceus]KAG1850367.1 hypothetical protein DFJ58DRAFT_729245 [Suillus subalutaceus]